jgi:hypothetical protein
MAVATRDGHYLCGYCGKKYTSPSKADSCRDSHELIYVAFTHADLNSLLHYIQTKDEAFLTESLMNTLQTYLKGN